MELNFAQIDIFDQITSELRAQLSTRFRPIAAELLEHSCSLEDIVLRSILRVMDANRHYLADLIIESFGYLQDCEQDIGATLYEDIIAITLRDPACQGLVSAICFYKGFHALVMHRMAHNLWKKGETFAARELNRASSATLSVDIHPGAKLGRGIFIDHATAVVIGETSVVGDNVSMFHGVTLGGTGKDSSKCRHPVVENNVLLSSYCSILGSLKVGRGSRVAASSVVLNDVPPFTTVAGIPAKIVKRHSSIEQNTSWDFDIE